MNFTSVSYRHHKSSSINIINALLNYYFTILIILIVYCNPANAVNIGIYSDYINYTTCIQDSFYTNITLYLVASELNGESIAGWECAILPSSTIVMNLNVIHNGGINMGSCYEYIVGLSEPIVPMYNDSAILAEFSVFAFNPGGIALLSVTNPSLPNSEMPLLSLSNSIGELVECETNVLYKQYL